MPGLCKDQQFVEKKQKKGMGAVEEEYSRVYSKLKGQRMERLKLRVGKETDRSREDSGEVRRGPAKQDSYNGEGPKLCLEDHGVL